MPENKTKLHSIYAEEAEDAKNYQELTKFQVRINFRA